MKENQLCGNSQNKSEYTDIEEGYDCPSCHRSDGTVINSISDGLKVYDQMRCEACYYEWEE